jgi:ubiquinone/menaquinone biosynthesis C-methylase UbiE
VPDGLVHNIDATVADGSMLPYEPASLDGAYLIDVLGEMPDARAALRELHRILKPGGRLVVGE